VLQEYLTVLRLEFLTFNSIDIAADTPENSMK